MRRFQGHSIPAVGTAWHRPKIAQAVVVAAEGLCRPAGLSVPANFAEVIGRVDASHENSGSGDIDLVDAPGFLRNSPIAG